MARVLSRVRGIVFWLEKNFSQFSVQRYRTVTYNEATFNEVIFNEVVFK